MRKFRKWFLVVLILVIGWNINCAGFKFEKVAVSRNNITKNCADEFLDNIFDRIWQEVPDKHNFQVNISYIRFSGTYAESWFVNSEKGKFSSIFIGRDLLLKIENEAEIAYTIAHEIGHIIERFFTPPSLEEYEIDCIAVKLMARVGYNTSCAIDINQRLLKIEKEDYRKLEIEITNIKDIIETGGISNKEVGQLIEEVKTKEMLAEGYRKEFERIEIYLPKYAEECFQENQNCWILFTPEDLEKIKTFCKTNGE